MNRAPNRRGAGLQIAARAAFACTFVYVTYAALIPKTAEGDGPDKLLHFAAFLVLGLLGLAAWPSRRKPVMVCIALIVFGAAIEVIQPLTGRERSFADWVADCAGIAAAVMGAGIWSRWRVRAQK